MPMIPEPNTVFQADGHTLTVADEATREMLGDVYVAVSSSADPDGAFEWWSVTELSTL